jgi:hypothetical protein
VDSPSVIITGRRVSWGRWLGTAWAVWFV